MKTRFTVAILLAIVAAAIPAQTPDSSLRRMNVGLMLDAPFLSQSALPFGSDYHGAYGDETVSFEYTTDRLPSLIRYSDADTGAPILDIRPGFRADGHIETLAYATYDDTGSSVLYVDLFTFESYTPAGPRLGKLTSTDGGSAEMRLTYDASGRLIGIEEDDPFGDGLYRQARYAWEEKRGVPYAAEVRYPIDGEVERYTFLFDARGRLRATDGVNILESDPTDTAAINEWFAYESGSLEEIFGRVRPGTTTSATAMR